MKAEVSVIVPCFNRPTMVREAIASVLAQQEVDYELIVIDDGSADETANLLEHLCERPPAAAQRPVRLLHTANCGPAVARNRGVEMAAAPLIAFLDSDDLWAPDKLARQLEMMRRLPHCAALQTEEIWLRRGVRVNPGVRHRKPRGDFLLDSLRTCLISPSAVMMRIEVFHELGGFDQELRAAEDYELWLRLLLRYPVELLPEPLVIRRGGHGDQLSATVPALDRFRIHALLKLLLHHELGAIQRAAVCAVLSEKCAVYAGGLARRDCEAEAAFVTGLGQRAAAGRLDGSTLETAIARMRAHLTDGSPARILMSGAG